MASENEENDDGEILDVGKCPQCPSVSEHDILKRTKKGKGEDILAKCLEWGIIHLIELRPPSKYYIF